MLQTFIGITIAPAIVLGVFLCSRILARFVLYRDMPANTNDTVIQWFNLLVYPIIMVASFGPARLLQLQTTIPVTAALFANTGLSLGIVLGSHFALQRGVEPIRTAYRDGEWTVPEQFVRLQALLIVAFCTPVALVVEASFVGMYPDGIYWVPLLIVVLWAGILGLFGQPLTNFGSLQARHPNAAERARIEHCYETIDREPPAYIGIDPSPLQNSVQLSVIGWGSLTTLWIAEEFFEDIDDETLAVVLTQAVEKNRNGFHSFVQTRNFAKILFVISLPYVLIPTQVGVPVFTLFFVYLAFASMVIIMPWADRNARQATYEADETVSESLGNQTVRRVYGSLGETVNQLQTESIENVQESPVLDIRLNFPEPSIGTRIRQLAREETRSSVRGFPRTLWLVGLLAVAVIAVHLYTFPTPAIAPAVVIVQVLLSMSILLDSTTAAQTPAWPPDRLKQALYVGFGLVPLWGPAFAGYYILKRLAVMGEASVPTR